MCSRWRLSSRAYIPFWSSGNGTAWRCLYAGFYENGECTVTVRLKLPDSRLQYFVYSVGRHESFPRNIRRDRSRCVWSVLVIVYYETFPIYYTQTCKLKIDQHTIAVTISSQLCSFPYLCPLWSLTFGCPVLLVSCFSRKPVTCRQANPKYRFNRNTCIPLPTAITRKGAEAFYGNEVCQTSTPFSNRLVSNAESN
jgi:hypothetical protein